MATERATSESTTDSSRVAIAKRGEAGAVDIDVRRLDHKRFNVLAHTDKVVMISPYYQCRMMVVDLSPDPADGDCYKQGSRPVPNGEGFQDLFALTKVGLNKLADAGAVIWNHSECRRLDDLKDRNYVSFQAVGGIRMPDGTFKPLKASKEIDMEVIEEKMRLAWEEKQAKARRPMSDADRDAGFRKELLQFREHKAARCETGAMNRVLRALFCIKNTYTREEIARPWIVPRIEFAPDYNDPRVRQVTDTALKAMMEYDFGGEPKKLTPAQHEAIDEFEGMTKLPSPEWVDEETGEVIEGDSTEIEAVPADDEDAPPAEEPSSGLPPREVLLADVRSAFVVLKWNRPQQIAFAGALGAQSIDTMTNAQLAEATKRLSAMITKGGE